MLNDTYYETTPLYSSTNWLDAEGILYTRQVYNCLDFMGEVAGVLELLCWFFCIFVSKFID
jgi:hypothetical protein